MAKQRDEKGRFVGATGDKPGQRSGAGQRNGAGGPGGDARRARAIGGTEGAAVAERVPVSGRRANGTAFGAITPIMLRHEGDSGKGRRKLMRQRSDAFTAARQDRFFETLSETSNVLLSCSVAGIAPQTAYIYRRRDASFAARWNKALADAVADLRMRVAAQGRFGQTTETIFAVDANGARKITTVREIAPTALRTLVAAGGDADASDRADHEAAEREAREIRLAAAERVILNLLKDVVPPENSDG